MQNAKWMKRVTTTRVKLLSYVIWMEFDVSIVSAMGLAGIALMSATSPLPRARATHIMNTRKDPTS
eukprot:5547193-Ditylum_brightwellii.AAC.1